MGGGMGRGMGGGMGRGRGMAPGTIAGQQESGSLSREEEIVLLRQQRDEIRNQVEAIDTRLRELEGK